MANAVRWLEAATTRRAAVAVFAGFAVLYLATATYTTTQSVDTVAAAVPAWNLVEHGTLRLDEFRDANEWFIPTPDGVFSNRFPGVIFVAVPAYALAELAGLSPADSPTLVPAGITAALVTAAAMATLYAVFARLVPAPQALLAVVIAGLGTSTWSVSADALWTHGPAQLYLSVGMLALALERFASAGVAFAVAVFTRPQIAVIPLVTGTWETIRKRSLWPAGIIGALSALGLAALIAYNAAVFGEPSITGGYGDYAAENLAGMAGPTYLMNWVMTLISPTRGILPYSPFLLAALPRLREAWRKAQPWVRVSAISGLAYMALQLRVNHWSGGDTFFAYRLPLEMLTLLAPLLLLSTRAWLTSPLRRRAFTVAVVYAVALQTFGATAYLPLLLQS